MYTDEQINESLDNGDLYLRSNIDNEVHSKGSSYMILDDLGDSWLVESDDNFSEVTIDKDDPDYTLVIDNPDTLSEETWE
jgi:hypothetical protein